jgi:glycerol-3-phosphate acyltransferase PlsX
MTAWPVLNRFKRRVDHRRHNGASLLGLRGLVLKSHGSADAVGFESALERGYEEARHRVLERTIAAMQPYVEQLERRHRAQPSAAASA